MIQFHRTAPFLACTAFLTVATVTGVGCQNKDVTHFTAVAKELPKEKERAARLGVPLDPRDFIADEPPREDNISYQLREASRRLAEPRLRAVISEVLAPDSGKRPVAAQYRSLAPLNSSLDAAVTALERPNVRRAKSDVAELSDFRRSSREMQLAKLLALRGHLRAKRGDAAGSLRDFAAVLRLAELTATEPGSMPVAMTLYLITVAVRSIEVSLPAQARNETYLAQLRASLAPVAKVPDLRRALQGDSAIQFATLLRLSEEEAREPVVQPPSDDDSGNPDQYLPPEDAARVKRDRQRLYAIPPAIRNDAILARELQYANTIAELAAEKSDPVQLHEALAAAIQRLDLKNDLTYFVLREVPTEPEVALEPLQTSIARIASLDALLAVLQYRNRTGRWPDSLAAAGVNATDPFTRQPYRMKRDSAALRIYSPGPPRIENAGRRVRLIETSTSGALRPEEIGVTFPL